MATEAYAMALAIALAPVSPTAVLAVDGSFSDEALAEAPKSLQWRLRARVGERIQWYELPEEVRRG